MSMSKDRSGIPVQQILPAMVKLVPNPSLRHLDILRLFLVPTVPAADFRYSPWDESPRGVAPGLSFSPPHCVLA
jgi:hypothetical protein